MGVTLQSLEGDILLKTMITLLDQDIPSLPMHDAVYVQQQFAGHAKKQSKMLGCSLWMLNLGLPQKLINKLINMNKNVSLSSTLSILLLLLSCSGGGGGSENVSEPTDYSFSNIKWRQTTNSITLTNDWLNSLSYEGFNTFDFDGSGNKSFFFPPGNESRNAPRLSTDPDFQLFQVDSNNRVIQLPSPLASKYIAGHVNDDILIGNFGGNGSSLIFIDHGREPQNIPYSQWELSYLWRMDKINGAWSVTEFGQNLGKQFWHSSSNPIDINSDGVLDFVAATINSSYLFLSSNNTLNATPLKNSNNQGLSCGATALIKLVNNNFGAICLPYTPNSGYSTAELGYIVTFGANGQSVLSTQEIHVRNTPTTQGISDVEGYNLIRVTDLNNDGLDDFLGFAESRDGSNGKTKKIIAFIQNANGQFIQANESLGIKFDYTLPYANSEYYSDGVDSKAFVVDVNGDQIKDIAIPTSLISHADILRKGIRGGYIKAGNKYSDLMIPSNKIIWNNERAPYNYRYILPIEINGDGIVDYVFIGSTFDQQKTTTNPNGQIFHLTILTSEITR